MKKLTPVNLIAAAVLIASSFIFAQAQDPPDGDMPDRPPMNDGRGQLMRELGLTQDQIRRIRMLNQERRPLIQEAQRRQMVASRQLDQAIYADVVDEAAVQLRLKELQLAQAEFAKIRAINELEVRKILTTEQLVKFRELRQRFANRVRDRVRGDDQSPVNRPPQGRRPNAPVRRPGDRPPRQN